MIAENSLGPVADISGALEAAIHISDEALRATRRVRWCRDDRLDAPSAPPPRRASSAACDPTRRDDARAASITTARVIRNVSPARRASRRPRAWKSAPRMMSMLHRPVAADQHISILYNSPAGIWLASRGRKLSPRRISRVCCRRSDAKARRGVLGNRMPTAWRTSRSTARPPLT